MACKNPTTLRLRGSGSAGGPLALNRGLRHLVVAAVCNGWCATYDTEADVLTPFRLGTN